MAAATSRHRPVFRVPALLILLSAVPAMAGAVRLVQLAGGAEITPENARFFAMPVPVVIHIVAVIPFSILGAFQFVPSLRRRGSSWHRVAGRALVPLGRVAALSGLWMTQFYPWAEGDGTSVYVFRLVFGWAMVVAIALGMDALRRRDFAAHGAWMLRAYAIGMGAGTQVLTHLPLVLLGGEPAGFGRAAAMGGGWVINVVVAEWIVRRGRTSTRSVSENGGPARRAAVGVGS